uniref:Uncharacterized protein n=1 Tax=Rhizophora mucronata TaxID=61149 RepID=A0A2P2J3B7_RHIMU
MTTFRSFGQIISWRLWRHQRHSFFLCCLLWTRAEFPCVICKTVVELDFWFRETF